MRVALRERKKAALAILAGIGTAIAIAAPAIANPVVQDFSATASRGAAMARACHNNVSAGGGSWEYGACSSTGVNYSYYHHGSRKHQASVTNGRWGYNGSGCKDPGVWANAVQAYDVNGGNRAYYSNDLCG